MTKEWIGCGLVLVLTACATYGKMDAVPDTALNDGGSFNPPTGCETMANWFQSCSEATLELYEAISECESNLNEIEAECDSDAASAYSDGLAATYECYLEIEYCGTETDANDQSDAIEQCGALFDEWIEPYEECIYSTSDDNPEPLYQVEPVSIDFVEPVELQNTLELTDDSFAHLELPFPLSFFDEAVDTLTVTSNGLILIGAHDEDGCCFGLPIPQEDHLDGLIAMGWGDLIPSTEHQVSWDVIGEIPNRTLWISYDHLPSYSGEDNVVATRLRIQEGSKDYDIFIDSIVYDEPMTVGLESPNGQVAVVKENHSARPIVLERAAYRYTASVPQ